MKNSLAVLVRVMEQAVRDGIIDRNPARVTGWQREYQRAEDELDDPRSLALPDWETLSSLATALVERSADKYAGWGDVVIFAACTAARIGEVSGVRVGEIDREAWTWTVRRQTTPSPGGAVDKGTKGKRARVVQLILEVRDLVARRLDALGSNPSARLFTGPRGGRIITAVLRDVKRSGPRAQEDRRTRIIDDNPEISSPGHALHIGGWGRAQCPPGGQAVPRWSPAQGCLVSRQNLHNRATSRPTYHRSC
ncbi:hypothetical protein ACQP25_30625 [Microtetraspora malaysiensis]|uniref:hypothetical protein n=1 Tax=Microtetraspora malaysiensis TaxID=161358 RepID=UPI003D92CEC4